MRHPARSTTTRFPVLHRIAAAGVLGLGVALIAAPRPAAAADPTPSAPPAETAGPSVTPDPTPTAVPTPTSAPDPTPTPDPSPTPTTDPRPTPDPTPAPTPRPLPAPPAAVPSAMNLYVASGFRFQDPNGAACTATSARSMLNFIAMRGTGGDGFLWRPTVLSIVRDGMLTWQRMHDTLAGGRGSDPHGWRNALNYYGWGQQALWYGYRTYDDFSYNTYDAAMKAAVRAMILTGKPVGMLGWRGAHAQMITGYYGLKGNPFAVDAAGRFADRFSVTGFYITDPLRKSGIVNRQTRYATLKATRNYRLRFQRYRQRDSTYDDPYTPGIRPSRDEWYGRFVLVKPIR